MAETIATITYIAVGVFAVILLVRNWRDELDSFREDDNGVSKNGDI